MNERGHLFVVVVRSLLTMVTAEPPRIYILRDDNINKEGACWGQRTTGMEYIISDVLPKHFDRSLSIN